MIEQNLGDQSGHNQYMIRQDGEKLMPFNDTCQLVILHRAIEMIENTGLKCAEIVTNDYLFPEGKSVNEDEVIRIGKLVQRTEPNEFVIHDPGPKGQKSTINKLTSVNGDVGKVFDRFRFSIITSKLGTYARVKDVVEGYLLGNYYMDSGFFVPLTSEERTLPNGRVVPHSNPVEYNRKSTISNYVEENPYEFVYNFRMKTGEKFNDYSVGDMGGKTAMAGLRVEMRVSTVGVWIAMNSPYRGIGHNTYKDIS